MSDDLPKLATNDLWRGIMRRARTNDHKMTQGELAIAVGRVAKGEPPSQALISKIESGAIESSEYVMPICEVLGIAPPEHFVSEDDRDWARLGRLLRSKGMSTYKKWVSLLEDVAGPDEPDVQTSTEPDPTRPDRK